MVSSQTIQQVDTAVAAEIVDFKETNPKDLVGVKKPAISFIPNPALLFLSKVMVLGAKKYGKMNWRSKPIKYSVYYDAAMRHMMAMIDGQNNDPESNMPHAAHVMACMSIILDAIATGNLIDDRHTPTKTAELISELTEK